MSRLPLGISFERLMIGLLFGALGATALLVPAQSDSFWHLRAGEEIWRTLHVPFVEHYSHTAAGRPWPDHEWLWQAFAYGLVRLGGLPLLTAAGAALGMGAFVLAYRSMVGPPRVRFVLMVLGTPLVPCVWALRPQLVSLLLLMVLLRLLVRERYLWIPLLFVLWANVHGAVALGVVVLGAAGIVALWRARGGDRRDRRRVGILALVSPLSVLATAATPMGFGLWSYIVESTTLSRQTRIIEWLPAYPTGFVEIGFWLLALTFLWLVVRGRRSIPTASWGDLVLVAAALVLFALAVRAVRNIPPFLLVAMPAASRLLPLGPSLRFGPPDAPAVAADRPRFNLALLVAISLVELAVVAKLWAMPHPRLGWRPIDDGALAAVRACPANLYNRYNDGGYLIWFAPQVPVFIDSRQDPYPLSLLLEQINLEDGAPYRPTFDRLSIRCAFLPAGDALASRLRADGWRASYTDARWTVLVRSAGETKRHDAMTP